MIPGLAKNDYQTRLSSLGIWSLEDRRNRADIIEASKILNRLSAIPANSLFERSVDARTRGHSMKFIKHLCNTDLRKYFFSERVTDRRNRLDQRCVDAQSVNAFKNQLNRLRSTRIDAFMD